MIRGIVFDCFGVLILPGRLRNSYVMKRAETLHGQYKTAMLSNVGHGVIETLFTEQELGVLFDVVVRSSDVGHVKPEPEIYVLTATKLGLLPEECVMIDDIELHVDGARRAGMQAILYRSPEQLDSELTKLLGKGRYAGAA